MTRDFVNAKSKGVKGEELLLQAITKVRPNHDFYSDRDRTIDIKSKTLGFIEVKSEGVEDVRRMIEAKKHSDFPPPHTNKIHPGFYMNGKLTRKYMIMSCRLRKGDFGGVFKAVIETAHTGMPTLLLKQFFRPRIMDPSGHVHELGLVYMIFYAPHLARIVNAGMDMARREFAHNYDVRRTGKGELVPINTATHGIVNFWHGEQCPHDQRGLEHEPMAKSGTRECRIRVDLEILARNLRRANLRPPIMDLEKALAFMEAERARRIAPPPTPTPSERSDTPSSQRSYSDIPPPSEEEKSVRSI